MSKGNDNLLEYKNLISTLEWKIDLIVFPLKKYESKMTEMSLLKAWSQPFLLM